MNPIKNDFPVLNQKINGKDLVYLDSAATAQKPKAVIERMTRFYTEEYATVHRGVYTLSQNATQACDDVRTLIKDFINAKSCDEVVFVKGTTEGINLVAHSYVRKFLTAGDEILITAMEHHANIVPWQLLCERYGFKLVVAPMNENGELKLEEFKALLSSKTKFVSFTHISNALGTINPVKQMTAWAQKVGAKVLIDGAQGIVHDEVDVQDLGADFYTFSGHKLYAPTGIGVLYAKLELLRAMDPFLSGGDMIESVTFEKTTFAEPPLKFEAGTPAIAEIIGLGEAISYVQRLGWERIQNIEKSLFTAAVSALKTVDGLVLVGTAKEKASVISFILDGVHPHDAGTILDEEGIAVRVGHHCAQPVMKAFGIAATIRASFSIYNTEEDIRRLLEGIQIVKKVLKVAV